MSNKQLKILTIPSLLELVWVLLAVGFFNFVLFFHERSIYMISLSVKLLSTLIMTNEKFTLTWHSYASHFQEVLVNLSDTGESSDVTLVCDDQVKPMTQSQLCI